MKILISLCYYLSCLFVHHNLPSSISCLSFYTLVYGINLLQLKGIDKERLEKVITQLPFIILVIASHYILEELLQQITNIQHNANKTKSIKFTRRKTKLKQTLLPNKKMNFEFVRQMTIRYEVFLLAEIYVYMLKTKEKSKT